MSECEDKVLSTLVEGRHGTGADVIAIIVLDGSTPREMGQIFHSILTVVSHQDMLFDMNNHHVMAMSNRPKSETWQRNMLDRYRKHLYYDPAKVVQIDINVDGANMELGIISNNDMIGFKTFKLLEQKLNDRLARNDVVAVIDLVRQKAPELLRASAVRCQA